MPQGQPSTGRVRRWDSPSSRRQPSTRASSSPPPRGGAATSFISRDSPLRAASSEIPHNAPSPHQGIHPHRDGSRDRHPPPRSVVSQGSAGDAPRRAALREGVDAMLMDVLDFEEEVSRADVVAAWVNGWNAIANASYGGLADALVATSLALSPATTVRTRSPSPGSQNGGRRGFGSSSPHPAGGGSPQPARWAPVDDRHDFELADMSAINDDGDDDANPPQQQRRRGVRTPSGTPKRPTRRGSSDDHDDGEEEVMFDDPSAARRSHHRPSPPTTGRGAHTRRHHPSAMPTRAMFSPNTRVAMMREGRRKRREELEEHRQREADMAPTMAVEPSDLSHRQRVSPGRGQQLPPAEHSTHHYVSYTSDARRRDAASQSPPRGRVDDDDAPRHAVASTTTATAPFGEASPPGRREPSVEEEEEAVAYALSEILSAQRRRDMNETEQSAEALLMVNDRLVELEQQCSDLRGQRDAAKKLSESFESEVKLLERKLREAANAPPPPAPVAAPAPLPAGLSHDEAARRDAEHQRHVDALQQELATARAEAAAASAEQRALESDLYDAQHVIRDLRGAVDEIQRQAAEASDDLAASQITRVAALAAQTATAVAKIVDDAESQTRAAVAYEEALARTALVSWHRVYRSLQSDETERRHEIRKTRDDDAARIARGRVEGEEAAWRRILETKIGAAMNRAVAKAMRDIMHSGSRHGTDSKVLRRERDVAAARIRASEAALDDLRRSVDRDEEERVSEQRSVGGRVRALQDALETARQDALQAQSDASLARRQLQDYVQISSERAGNERLSADEAAARARQAELRAQEAVDKETAAREAAVASVERDASTRMTNIVSATQSVLEILEHHTRSDVADAARAERTLLAQVAVSRGAAALEASESQARKQIVSREGRFRAEQLSLPRAETDEAALRMSFVASERLERARIRAVSRRAEIEAEEHYERHAVAGVRNEACARDRLQMLRVAAFVKTTAVSEALATNTTLFEAFDDARTRIARSDQRLSRATALVSEGGNVAVYALLQQCEAEEAAARREVINRRNAAVATSFEAMAHQPALLERSLVEHRRRVAAVHALSVEVRDRVVADAELARCRLWIAEQAPRLATVASEAAARHGIVVRAHTERADVLRDEAVSSVVARAPPPPKTEVRTTQVAAEALVDAHDFEALADRETKNRREVEWAQRTGFGTLRESWAISADAIEGVVSAREDDATTRERRLRAAQEQRAVAAARLAAVELEETAARYSAIDEEGWERHGRLAPLTTLHRQVARFVANFFTSDALREPMDARTSLLFESLAAVEARRRSVIVSNEATTRLNATTLHFARPELLNRAIADMRNRSARDLAASRRTAIEDTESLIRHGLQSQLSAAHRELLRVCGPVYRLHAIILEKIRFYRDATRDVAAIQTAALEAEEFVRRRGVAVAEDRAFVGVARAATGLGTSSGDRAALAATTRSSLLIPFRTHTNAIDDGGPELAAASAPATRSQAAALHAPALALSRRLLRGIERAAERHGADAEALLGMHWEALERALEDAWLALIRRREHAEDLTLAEERVGAAHDAAAQQARRRLTTSLSAVEESEKSNRRHLARVETQRRRVLYDWCTGVAFTMKEATERRRELFTSSQHAVNSEKRSAFEAAERVARQGLMERQVEEFTAAIGRWCGYELQQHDYDADQSLTMLSAGQSWRAQSHRMLVDAEERATRRLLGSRLLQQLAFVVGSARDVIKIEALEATKRAILVRREASGRQHIVGPLRRLQQDEISRRLACVADEFDARSTLGAQLGLFRHLAALEAAQDDQHSELASLRATAAALEAATNAEHHAALLDVHQEFQQALEKERARGVSFAAEATSTADEIMQDAQEVKAALHEAVTREGQLRVEYEERIAELIEQHGETLAAHEAAWEARHRAIQEEQNLHHQQQHGRRRGSCVSRTDDEDDDTDAGTSSPSGLSATTADELDGISAVEAAMMASPLRRRESEDALRWTIALLQVSDEEATARSALMAAADVGVADVREVAAVNIAERSGRARIVRDEAAVRHSACQLHDAAMDESDSRVQLDDLSMHSLAAVYAMGADARKNIVREAQAKATRRAKADADADRAADAVADRCHTVVLHSLLVLESAAMASHATMSDLYLRSHRRVVDSSTGLVALPRRESAKRTDLRLDEAEERAHLTQLCVDIAYRIGDHVAAVKRERERSLAMHRADLDRAEKLELSGRIDVSAAAEGAFVRLKDRLLLETAAARERELAALRARASQPRSAKTTRQPPISAANGSRGGDANLSSIGGSDSSSAPASPVKGRGGSASSPRVGRPSVLSKYVSSPMQHRRPPPDTSRESSLRTIGGSSTAYDGSPRQQVSTPRQRLPQTPPRPQRRSAAADARHEGHQSTSSGEEAAGRRRQQQQHPYRVPASSTGRRRNDSSDDSDNAHGYTAAFDRVAHSSVPRVQSRSPARRKRSPSAAERAQRNKGTATLNSTATADDDEEDRDASIAVSASTLPSRTETPRGPTPSQPAVAPPMTPDFTEHVAPEMMSRWQSHQEQQLKIQRLEVEASEHWARSLVAQLEGGERDVLVSRATRHRSTVNAFAAPSQATTPAATPPRSRSPEVAPATRTPSGSPPRHPPPSLPRTSSGHASRLSFAGDSDEVSALRAGGHLPHAPQQHMRRPSGMLSEAYRDPFSWDAEADAARRREAAASLPQRVHAAHHASASNSPRARHSPRASGGLPPPGLLDASAASVGRSPSVQSSSYQSGAQHQHQHTHHHPYATSPSRPAVHGMAELYGGVGNHSRRGSRREDASYTTDGSQSARGGPSGGRSASEHHHPDEQHFLRHLAAEDKTRGTSRSRSPTGPQRSSVSPGGRSAADHGSPPRPAHVPQLALGRHELRNRTSESPPRRREEEEEDPQGLPVVRVTKPSPRELRAHDDVMWGDTVPPLSADGDSAAGGRGDDTLRTVDSDSASSPSPMALSSTVRRSSAPQPQRQQQQQSRHDEGTPRRAPLFKPYFGLRLSDGVSGVSPATSRAPSVSSTPRGGHKVSLSTSTRVGVQLTPRGQRVTIGSRTSYVCLRVADVRDPSARVLQVGDLVVAINERPVATLDEANRQLHLVAKRVDNDAESSHHHAASEREADQSWPPQPTLQVLGGSAVQHDAANAAGFRFDILRGGDPDAAETVFVRPEWRPASGGENQATSRTPSIPASAVATPRTRHPAFGYDAPVVGAADNEWGSPVGATASTATPRGLNDVAARRHWP